MKRKFRILDICNESVYQDAVVLRESGRLLQLQQSVLPGGKILLRGKSIDSFHFVDHPRVVLADSGAAILEFSCDCPAFRATRYFCMHCAALTMEIEEEEPQEKTDSLTENAVSNSQTDAEPDPVQESPVLEDFSYAFCNSARDLYPGVRTPRIPLARYQQMFGHTVRAKTLYQMAGTWSGSCFGMVATSTMLQQPDSGIDIADFDMSAEKPSDLMLADHNETLDATLHQFVEMAHIMQYDGYFGSKRNQYLADIRSLQTLAEQVTAFQCGESFPVGMAVWKTSKMDGGHSVLPFRLERISKTEDRLSIYDPNWPMKIRYAFLEKDEAGKYTNWRFPMNDSVTYSSDTGSKLALDMYDVYKKTWDDRSGAASDALLRVAMDVTVQDASGTVLAKVDAEGVRSYRNEVHQVLLTNGVTGAKDVLIRMPAGCYTIRNDAADGAELTLELVGVDLSVAVTTNAQQVVVSVEDASLTACAQIDEPDCKYSVLISSTIDGIDEEVNLQGVTSAEGLYFMKQGRQLFGKGIVDAVLQINAEQTALSRIAELQEENLQQEQREQITNALPEEESDHPEG